MSIGSTTRALATMRQGLAQDWQTIGPQETLMRLAFFIEHLESQYPPGTPDSEIPADHHKYVKAAKLCREHGLSKVLCEVFSELRK